MPVNRIKRNPDLKGSLLSGEMEGLFRRSSASDMNLGDILSSSQLVPELLASTRWEAIDELIGQLVNAGRLKPTYREAVTAAVRKREMSMSTGIGFGIGIPHASTDLISEVIGAFARSTRGVNFDSLDNQPVHLVMLFLVPQGQFQRHLHTLAHIAKVLRSDTFHKAILAARDAEGMMQIIREFSANAR